MTNCTIDSCLLPLPADLPGALDLERVFSALQQHLPDHRAKRGVRYPLVPMVMIALLAKLAGAHRIADIAAWATHRTTLLVPLLGLTRSTMPHARTWSRLFAALDPSTLHQGFLSALTAGATELPRRGERLLALDGKTMRGTIPLGQTQGVHLLAVFCPDQGMVLAQQRVAEKTNEITAAPTVLAAHDLTGCVVTGDALHCQRALSATLRAAKSDYLWIVKANQRDLLTDIQAAFAPPPPALPGWSDPPMDIREARTLEASHGRIDERILRATTMLAEYTAWPGLAQVLEIQRHWTDSAGQNHSATRYAVTSLPAEVASPARLLELVRGHWQIENSLHYRRDVTLNEDRSLLRTGNGPEVMAVFNNTVIALYQRTDWPSLPAFQRAFEPRFTLGMAQRCA